MNLQKIIIIITVITAAIMELIDTSIVNVGINTMAGNLGVSVEDISWVITSYAIANVIIIPMTSFLQKYFGRKNYFLTSIIVFTVASYFCGTANDLWTLVAFRFLQGIGGGALLSVSQGILFDTFSIKQRPMASAMFGIGIVLGPTFGPTLGGIIIDNYHWSWMFFINLPIGIAAFFLTYIFVDKKPEEENIDRKSINIDTIGIILLAIGIGSLQYVLERGSADDWFDNRTILNLTITAVVAIGAFIWWELSIPNPVVDLRVFKNRNLALGTLLIVVIGFGLFTSVFLYPLFAQRVVGLTATVTGKLLIPGAGITLFIFPIVGQLMSRGLSPRILVFFGYIAFFIFCLLMTRLNADAYAWLFIGALMVRGIGLALTNIPLINTSVSTLKPYELPTGIAITNMFRQLGGALGIAIVNTYITNRTGQHRADLVANVVLGQSATDERIAGAVQRLQSQGIGLQEATQMAYANINNAVNKQALMLSYLDAFELAAWFFVLSLPLILLIRSTRPSAATLKAAAEAH